MQTDHSRMLRLPRYERGVRKRTYRPKGKTAIRDITVRGKRSCATLFLLEDTMLFKATFHCNWGSPTVRLEPSMIADGWTLDDLIRYAESPAFRDWVAALHAAARLTWHKAPRRYWLVARHGGPNRSPYADFRLFYDLPVDMPE